MKPFLALLFVAMVMVCAGSSSAAQPETDRSDGFYGLTNLWTLHLTVTPKDWQTLNSGGGPRRGGARGGGDGGGLLGGWMRGVWGGDGFSQRNAAERGQSASESDFPWAVCRFEAHGEVLTNVALRFKGVSSMVRAPNPFKRPFRIDFDRGATNRRFMGVTGFCLNNNVNDATQMREALAYDLFRRVGIPAPRTAFARVYLTIPGRSERIHLGLYTVVEPVSGEFLSRYFGTRKGLLLKPEMMRGLPYFGDEWEAYTERYGAKGTVDPADAERFIDFVRFLRRAGPIGFEEGLPARLDPRVFARFVALNALLANVDSFIGNGHNYYLFLPAGQQRITFIPWDLNESFGMHPVSGPSGDQMITSVLRPNADPNNLVERFLGHPPFAVIYRDELTAMLDSVFSPARLHAEIDRITAVTKPVVLSETERAREDFERTVLKTRAPQDGDISQPRHDREFARERYQPWSFPDAVEIDNMPLKDWISGRVEHVQRQLEGKTMGTRPRPRLF